MAKITPHVTDRILQFIDSETEPRRMDKRMALDVLERVRYGVISRIECLKEEIAEES